MIIGDRRPLRPAHLQVSTWRGDDRTVVVSPRHDVPPPTAAAIRRDLDLLRSRGVEAVVTGALQRRETVAFLDNGFSERERLHLLRHDLTNLKRVDAPMPIRRGSRRDRTAVLDLDARAFDDFWTLDAEGLTDAIRATPSSRFRVLRTRSGPVLGYYVTGTASRRGYLQRLAVDPARQGRGLGRALLSDALRALQHSGARQAFVNTQEGNERALGLYLSHGFVREPDWLSVLGLRFSGNAPQAPT